MSSGGGKQAPPADGPPPADLEGVIDLVKRYRAEVDRGFDAVSRMVQEQEERHQLALRAQKRWNYLLLAGLVVTMAVVIVLYWRTTSQA